MGVGNSTARVIVEMGFDIRANHPTKCPNNLEHLTRGSNADRIRDANPVHAHPVNGLV